MRYKIVSKNKAIIEKAKTSFNLLNMKEAKHIQEVDFWLIDIKSIQTNTISSYKNKMAYSHFLFIANDNQDIKICLDNGFKNYIKNNFTNEELTYWCKYYFQNPKKTTILLSNNAILDISKSMIIKNETNIELTPQELLLLLELSKDEYIMTSKLASYLKVNSQITIRTIVNRIRKKLGFEIFELKKGFGYKLKNNAENEIKKEILNSKEKEELEEQNKFLQGIIDSSPIFIATFIHKQLYCVNKSFRDFLGNDIIKELWDEERGDFFKLIASSSKENENLKEKLFSKGKHQVQIYNFLQKEENSFELETLYFETLDKHLLVFKLLK